jgi:hypothetical protein
MVRSIAHVHFREGERGPEEATLDFDDGLAILEEQSIEEVVVTFHLRHPRDLRPATPAPLLEKIAKYRGPVRLTLMPEANLVFSPSGPEDYPAVSHDIETWKDLSVPHDQLSPLLAGWILSAHFTKALGWTKKKDGERAHEQTYACAAQFYEKIMRQHWRGWIGHPFRWCGGADPQMSLKRTLAAAVETGHIVEIPVQGFGHGNPRSAPMLQPAIIAEFRGKPLVAISTDAHHKDQLKERIEATFRLAEWLVSEGVRPEQIWGWRS